MLTDRVNFFEDGSPEHIGKLLDFFEVGFLTLGFQKITDHKGGELQAAGVDALRVRQSHDGLHGVEGGVGEDKIGPGIEGLVGGGTERDEGVEVFIELFVLTGDLVFLHILCEDGLEFHVDEAEDGDDDSGGGFAFEQAGDEEHHIIVGAAGLDEAGDEAGQGGISFFCFPFAFLIALLGRRRGAEFFGEGFGGTFGDSSLRHSFRGPAFAGTGGNIEDEAMGEEEM